MSLLLHRELGANVDGAGSRAQVEGFSKRIMESRVKAREALQVEDLSQDMWEARLMFPHAAVSAKITRSNVIGRLAGLTRLGHGAPINV